jgi:hypothetical protein
MVPRVKSAVNKARNVRSASIRETSSGRGMCGVGGCSVTVNSRSWGHLSAINSVDRRSLEILSG